MTATAASTVKDQELVSFGLVESASVNSISDFTPSRVNSSGVIRENNKDNFANTFICHLIFYGIFCVSLVIHLLVDLGLGVFIQNKFSQLIGFRVKTSFDKSPAFA